MQAAGEAPICPAMPAPRLLTLLTLLALLLAPLAMLGGAPAMAHAGPEAASHCTETKAPAEAPPAAPVDCMIACAGCLPALPDMLSAGPLPLAAAEIGPLRFPLHGLHPEAATPPPRFS